MSVLAAGVDDRTELVGRFMRSALCHDSPLTPTNSLFAWMIERAAAHAFHIDRVPLDELTGWSFDPVTGNLAHDSGRFFSIEGLAVRADRCPVAQWTQPIIVQPEVGVLGILVKEFDGVLHCLMHAKMEPGNANTVQLSPTVQATRSNFTGVHRGASIRYLEYMRASPRTRILVDVLQSEQSSWFLHKRNRNMVVEALDDVPAHDDYCWLTVGQVTQLLRWADVVNMDTRTVLSCIPGAAPEQPRTTDPFGAAVLRSFHDRSGSRHAMTEVLSWLTEQRSHRELVQSRIPLRDTESDGWYRGADAISHRSGKYFSVIGVDVHAGNREVRSWRQPLVAPVEPGLLAFLARDIGGVLHVLVQARLDAGSLNGAEMAPSVHCQPVNYRGLPEAQQPPYLSYVLGVDPARIRYDVVQSEEGGRFFHARNRYVVVQVEDDFPLDAPDEYRWMTFAQLTSLLTHSNYLNVELRSLVACTRTLW